MNTLLRFAAALTLMIILVLGSVLSGYGQCAKFEPPDGKRYLVIGQDLGHVGGVPPGYTNGYYEAVASTSGTPAGITTYTDFPGLQGLWSNANWGSGDLYGDAIAGSANYSNSFISIGMQLWSPDIPGMAAGNFDGQIQQLANWCSAKGRPIFLRIGYEYDGGQYDADIAAFKGAWRRIVEKMREYGADNVAFVFQDKGTRYQNELEPYWPGADVVDWVGYSHFFHTSQNTGQGALGLAATYDKPVFIAECTPFGYDIAGGDPNSVWDGFFSDLFGFMDSHPQIKALAYINADWDSQPQWAGQGWGDARVQANATVLSRWNSEVSQDKWIKAYDNNFVDMETKCDNTPGARAGTDRTICTNVETLDLDGSVSNNTTQQWTTNGQGTIASASSASTSYTFASDDLAEIWFALTATGNGTNTDTMYITRLDCGAGQVYHNHDGDSLYQYTERNNVYPIVANPHKDAVNGSDNVLHADYGATGGWMYADFGLLAANTGKKMGNLESYVDGVGKFTAKVYAPAGSHEFRLNLGRRDSIYGGSAARWPNGLVLGFLAEFESTGGWQEVEFVLEQDYRLWDNTNTGCTIDDVDIMLLGFANADGGAGEFYFDDLSGGPMLEPGGTSNCTIDIDLATAATVCSSDFPIVLDATNSGADYEWSTGAATATITVQQGGSYAVTVSDDECTKTAEIAITSISCGAVGDSYNTHETADSVYTYTNRDLLGSYVDNPDPNAINSSDVVMQLEHSSMYAFIQLDFDVDDQGIVFDDLEPYATGDKHFKIMAYAQDEPQTITLYVGRRDSIYEGSGNRWPNGVYAGFQGTTIGADRWEEVVLTPIDLDGSVDFGGAGTDRTSNNMIMINPNNGIAGAATLFIDDLRGPDWVTPAPCTLVAEMDGHTKCEGESATIFPGTSGAVGSIVNYAWSTGSDAAQLTVTEQDEYSVTVTDEQGCTAVAAAQVFFEPAPAVNLGAGGDVCDDDLPTLDATTPDATYLWQDGSQSATFAVTESGVYGVTVTSDIGCAGTDEVELNVKDCTVEPCVLDIDLGENVTTCDSETLDATTPNADSYSWSTGAQTATIVADETGTYSVTVTKGECTGVGGVDVEIENCCEPPVVDLGTGGTFCQGSEQELDATTPGASYEWSTGAQTSKITVDTEGTYSVTVTVGECAGSDEVEIAYEVCGSGEASYNNHEGDVVYTYTDRDFNVEVVDNPSVDNINPSSHVGMFEHSAQYAYVFLDFDLEDEGYEFEDLTPFVNGEKHFTVKVLASEVPQSVTFNIGRRDSIYSGSAARWPNGVYASFTATTQGSGSWELLTLELGELLEGAGTESTGNNMMIFNPESGKTGAKTMYIDELKGAEIILPSAISVPEIVSISGITAYPNPFNSEFFLNGLRGANQVEVYTVAGALVAQNVTTQNGITISTGDFKPGIYLVVVTDQNGRAEQLKLFKQ